MVPRIEGWTTVLAGHWNRMIFTPEWVGQHLFPEVEQLETLVAIMPVFPMIYQDDRNSVQVASNRVMFHARQITDENLVRAESMARTTLTELDDTPLTGVGVNFEFLQENPPEPILSLFNVADSVQFAEADWDIGERKIVRRLQRGATVLNLTVGLQNGTVHFDFNFHTETRINADAQAAVTNRVLTLRDTAIALIADTYNLQLQ
jgi:hypothetical protein